MQQEAFPIVSENNNNEKKQENQTDTQENQTDTIVEQPATPEQNNVKSDQQQAEQPNEQTDESNTESEQIAEENETSPEKRPIESDVKDPFFYAVMLTSDSFVATVLETKSLKGEKISFHNVPDEADHYCLYTVKIEKVYRQTFVQPGMTIYYICKLTPDDVYWYDPLEIGKQYLLSGFAQEYNGKPLIFGTGVLDSEIKADKKLEPVSFNFKISEFKTLDELEADDEFKNYCQNKFSDIDFFDAMIFVDLETARTISGNDELKDVKELDKELFISYVMQNIAIE